MDVVAAVAEQRELAAALFEQLRRDGLDEPGVTRDPYGAGEQRAHATVTAAAQRLGLRIEHDDAANLYMTLLGRTPAAGRVIKDCPVCPDLLEVPAGQFLMGSPPGEPGRDDDEGPQHTVTIARPFAVGRYEITFDEWDACVAGGGCARAADDGWGRGRRPVIHVSYEQAIGYTEWLSTKTGKPYRLLSEAEWEYAARAGSRTAYVWGATADRACEFENGADAALRQILYGR